MVLTTHNSAEEVTSTSSLLRTSKLGVAFGEHKAVDDISVSFSGGRLTSIVGPNGAGKTTFFNLVSGQLRQTSGEIWLLEENISSLSAAKRAQMGLGRAFQLTNLFPRLSVLENVRLASQAKRRGRHLQGYNFWSIWDDEPDPIEHSLAVLEDVSLAHRRNAKVMHLSHGEQRRLEVAMLIAADPVVYMFDEPTAGMSADEAPLVLDLIRSLKGRKDKTVLLVEHKMEVVRELSDRVLVFHNGALVADGDIESVMKSSIVEEAYLGSTAKVTCDE